jgi:hypothetical protein
VSVHGARRGADRAADLATAASRFREDHRPPISLQVWLAASAPDRAGQAAAASDVPGRLGAHERKLALGRRGIEAVGTFAFSLGPASVAYYQFARGGYASRWLVPPWPPDRAGRDARSYHRRAAHRNSYESSSRRLPYL